MNNLEKRMIYALQDLKENYSVSGVKAEFEAEGTRIEEALRLKEVVMKADVELTIKIGGCEAIKDMYDCRSIGVQRIVAPMIESSYALKKFLLSAQTVFENEGNEDVKFAINVETIAGVNAFDDMLNIPEIKHLNGIVMGRADLTGSLNIGRNDINEDSVFFITRDLFQKSKSANLDNAVGGGVSAYSLPFFRKLGTRLIDRYETRKVVFECPKALNEKASEGILKAVGFEIMWLKNKKEYYDIISKEDDARLIMLESRYKSVIEEVGGKVG